MEYSATPRHAPVRFALPGLRPALRRWLLRTARPPAARRETPRPGRQPRYPAYGGPTGVEARLPDDDAPAPPQAGPTISELYHAHRLNMVRLAVLLVDDRATAEDVVQDAFAALYKRHGEELGEVDNALAYLRTAVVNAARSVLRRRRTARDYTPPHEADAPSAEERIVLDEEHREVFAALSGLTARRREVLVLRYWGDLTEAQIATTLGISRGSVKSIASRALDSLEKILEERS
ncbi:RNA polymerase sigma factor [Streptomyces decoyicus]|uniref:RNA polymerase sigma factor n=1 Tax=Streptomyces decoyicus TaxID=249567 RepID=UPI00069D1EE1|nr:SigE family RNA polymerase sigma factor [Streptomyces decoyicus]KOG38918.1 RNA polymerase [Streptomyces decoyicus]QZY17260.1 SigE family RNA polymerase sigma factor [Streptomyces decoyicus]